MNSTIQRITGYSFSLSHVRQNINKVALPAIALVAGMYMSAANADFKCYGRDFDGDCEGFCTRFNQELSQYNREVNRRSISFEFPNCSSSCQEDCFDLWNTTMWMNAK